jgi:hypothetical protein
MRWPKCEQSTLESINKIRQSMAGKKGQWQLFHPNSYAQA